MAPPALAWNLLAELQQIFVWNPAGPDRNRTHWVSNVVANREHFRAAIFVFSEGAGQRYFRISFAAQNPLQVFVSELDRQDIYVRMLAEDTNDWEAIAIDHWDYKFHVDVFSLLHWSQVLNSPADEIMVLPHSFFINGNACVCGTD